MRTRRFFFISIISGLLLFACQTRKDGSIDGMVVPPGKDIRISALLQGRESASAVTDPDGRFHLTLAPGVYDVHIQSPGTPFPLTLTAITVNPEQTTNVGTISIGPPASGSASIRGRIVGSPSGAHVILVSGEIERAAATVDRSGHYEFEAVPAGSYLVRAQSPGYANDSAAISVADGQKASVNMRLLYATVLDGVNWETGTVRVRGIGLPPQQAPTPTVRREMAKRAALLDAERNLLRVIDLVQTGPDEKLSDALGEKNYRQTLQGFLSGYRVVADRDLSGGRVEIELELPLTGPGGLSSYLVPR